METTLSTTPALSQAQPARRLPYFARHPWVGYGISLASLLLFGLLSWQVMTDGPLMANDLPYTQAIHEWARQQPTAVAFVMRFFSSYGRDGVALIALILTFAWARRKARRELYMLYFGFLGGELWFQVLSNLFGRERPEFKDPFETLIGHGYPSGHAATNLLLGWMVLYLLLPHLRTLRWKWLLTVGVVLYVIMVCLSRLFLGLHYVTDIFAGLLLGLAWGGFIYTTIDVLLFRKKRV